MFFFGQVSIEKYQINADVAFIYLKCQICVPLGKRSMRITQKSYHSIILRKLILQRFANLRVKKSNHPVTDDGAITIKRKKSRRLVNFFGFENFPETCAIIKFIRIISLVYRRYPKVRGILKRKFYINKIHRNILMHVHISKKIFGRFLFFVLY